MEKLADKGLPVPSRDAICTVFVEMIPHPTGACDPRNGQPLMVIRTMNTPNMNHREVCNMLLNAYDTANQEYVNKLEKKVEEIVTQQASKVILPPGGLRIERNDK